MGFLMLLICNIIENVVLHSSLPLVIHARMVSYLKIFFETAQPWWLCGKAPA